MRFTRLIPAIATIPELYSYYCDPCSESVTETFWLITVRTTAQPHDGPI
jgi:hypothetical protein